jgi:hypothetical protein
MFLKPLGTSFLEECFENKCFLSPQKLDEVVFKKYAPKSKDLSRKYSDKDGFAVVSKSKDDSENGYDVSIVYYDSDHRDIGRYMESCSDTLSNSLRPSVHNFAYNGTLDQIENKIGKEFEKLGIYEYSIIKSENSEITKYLFVRFMIKKQGKLIHEKTSLRAETKSKIQKAKSKKKK